MSEDRNVWLKERRAGIGGSDVPAILTGSQEKMALGCFR